jgi:uncharacterized OsmC-like protein
MGIGAGMTRLISIFTRKPEAGLHEDAAATAQWKGDSLVVVSHANGTAISTDMPAEIGGTGIHVTPGWLMRAALASCAATRISMSAHLEGIELSLLEVLASSRSDARGLLGMPDSTGQPVFPGVQDVVLTVHIAAPHVPADRLRALVAGSDLQSPVTATLRAGVPITTHIEVHPT